MCRGASRGRTPMDAQAAGDRERRGAYDWNAADYEQNSTMQFGLAEELLPRLRLAGWEHVLDLGCGSGRITAQIAGQVPAGAVTGVDVSPDMVAFARRQYPPAGHPNLHFEVMDAQALRFHREF